MQILGVPGIGVRKAAGENICFGLGGWGAPWEAGVQLGGQSGGAPWEAGGAT